MHIAKLIDGDAANIVLLDRIRPALGSGIGAGQLQYRIASLERQRFVRCLRQSHNALCRQVEAH